MPLIECQDCGRMISDRAAACIHCGGLLSTGLPSTPNVPGAVSEAPIRPSLLSSGRQREAYLQALMDEALDAQVGTETMPDNPEKALRLYKEAAALGGSGSWAYVSRMYRFGEGCRENEREALRWLHKGAEHEDPESLADLAEVYGEGGLGVDQDAENARNC